MDVQQPAGGGLVGSQLLLSLWKHCLGHGGGRVSAERLQGLRGRSSIRQARALQESSSRLFPLGWVFCDVLFSPSFSIHFT